MSDDIVIRAENVSKRYHISHLAGQGTLRDSMQHLARLAWRRLRWNARLTREEFWALRDINFEIKRGEVVGIIGRNGAGKSTLLKILSRITEPTTGRITLRGRVASLLEVGTGFHPELTGRDNIFLNGAILGMSRAEIRRKFDEIVAFAEVEKFLDTPVKRYSSGMYVRLAFAVAAHLEPEILVVDEVLAVGDAQFQKKCLGKIQDVARNQGRTVLFVSHNLIAVRALTQRCAYLQAGSLRMFDSTHAVLDRYAADLRSGGGNTDSSGRHSRVIGATLIDAAGNALTAHDGHQPTRLRVEVDTMTATPLLLECFLQDGEGRKLAICSPGHFTGWRLPAEPGRWSVTLTLQIPPLATGLYFFDVTTTHPSDGYDHYVPEAASCEVHALVMKPADWEYRREFDAGFFVMDGDTPPEISRR